VIEGSTIMKSLSFAGYEMVLYSGDEPWANWRAVISVGTPLSDSIRQYQFSTSHYHAFR
jgi:hypothetical protein